MEKLPCMTIRLKFKRKEVIKHCFRTVQCETARQMTYHSDEDYYLQNSNKFQNQFHK